MSSTQRRERERNTKRELILDAALNIFAEEGFERTTIRRIAEVIEYTPGAIYAYFSDKDEIFYELHTRGFDLLREHMMKAQDAPDAFSRLVKLGELYIAFALNNPHYYKIMFMLSNISVLLNKKFDALCKEGVLETLSGHMAYNMLKMLVSDSMAQGELPKANPDAAAVAIWSNVHGIVALYLDGRMFMLETDDLHKMIYDAYHFFVEMMRNNRDFIKANHPFQTT